MAESKLEESKYASIRLESKKKKDDELQVAELKKKDIRLELKKKKDDELRAAELKKAAELQAAVQAAKDRLERMRAERDMRAECRADGGSLTSSAVMKENSESNSLSTPENGAGEVSMGCVGGSAELPEGPVWEVGQRACIKKDLGVLLGTVSFIGEQTFAEGEWIGVVLDECVWRG